MNSLRLFFSLCVVGFGLQIPLQAMEEGAVDAQAALAERLLPMLPQMLSGTTLSQMEQSIEHGRDYAQVLEWTAVVLFVQENPGLVEEELLEQFHRWVDGYKTRVSIKSLWRLIFFAVKNDRMQVALFWYQFGLRDGAHYLPILPEVEDFFRRFITTATTGQLAEVINFFPRKDPLHQEIDRQINQHRAEKYGGDQAHHQAGGADVLDQINDARTAGNIEGLMQLAEQYPSYGGIIAGAVQGILDDQEGGGHAAPANQSLLSSISHHPVAVTVALGAAGAALIFWLSRR